MSNDARQHIFDRVMRVGQQDWRLRIERNRRGMVARNDSERGGVPSICRSTSSVVCGWGAGSVARYSRLSELRPLRG